MMQDPQWLWIAVGVALATLGFWVLSRFRSAAGRRQIAATPAVDDPWREQRQQALAKVRQAVWNMERTEEIEQVVRVVRQVLKNLEVPFQDIGINIIALTEDGPRIRLYFIGEHGKWLTENYILQQEHNPLMEIWRRGEPDYRRDLHRDDPRCERKEIEESVEHPVRSVLDMPFSHGTLALNSARPDAFSDRDIEVLTEMSAVISEGFQRMHDLEELEQRQEHLSSIIRAVPDIIYRLDRDGRITFISEAIERYGHRTEDLVGRSIFELVHPADREQAEYHLNERRTGERSTRALEIRMMTGEGRTDHEDFPVLLVNAEGIYSAFEPLGPNWRGTQGVARDITDRKELIGEELGVGYPTDAQ